MLRPPLLFKGGHLGTIDDAQLTEASGRVNGGDGAHFAVIKMEPELLVQGDSADAIAVGKAKVGCVGILLGPRNTRPGEALFAGFDQIDLPIHVLEATLRVLDFVPVDDEIAGVLDGCSEKSP